jgi:predicted DNA-binding transcriptional regulator YafY
VRADRLISMMLLLYAKRRMTARGLAAELEVSERTVYRDIEALCAAGIPIYTQSGPNGGIALDEQYRPSLTGLSREEVQALFVTATASPLHDLGMDKTDLLLKLFAALPNQRQAEVAWVRQRLHIDSANWFQVVETTPYVALLQQAVWEDRCVEVVYQPVEGLPRPRLIDAYGLVAKANIWYFVGKPSDLPNAGLRNHRNYRNYRVARFQQVTLSEQRFVRDASFDLAAYWEASCQSFESQALRDTPRVVATLHVHQSAFWFFPAYLEGHYQRMEDEPVPTGWLALRVTFDALSDAQMRLVALGKFIRVVAPEALRTSILETAHGILDSYGSYGDAASPLNTSSATGDAAHDH